MNFKFVLDESEHFTISKFIEKMSQALIHKKVFVFLFKNII
jgi:hypothetical protein